MVCEHEGKEFYERKKRLFKEWYWKNKCNPEFVKKQRERNYETYKKRETELKNLRENNKILEKQNQELREIIEQLEKEIKI